MHIEMFLSCFSKNDIFTQNLTRICIKLQNICVRALTYARVSIFKIYYRNTSFQFCPSYFLDYKSCSTHKDPPQLSQKQSRSLSSSSNPRKSFSERLVLAVESFLCKSCRLGYKFFVHIKTLYLWVKRQTTKHLHVQTFVIRN